jgi:DNA mismatch repair protein MutL
MHDVIQLLSDQVANQIAAGEVVQRPASIVKELLENSIDAKATSIQLHIKEAGRNLIQVSDNGIGMSVTDARMSFERHATSKIKSTQDIFSISTKGFRGEALASIAAVAQVELKTQREQDEIGTHLMIEGGNFINQQLIQHQKGSTFIVKNLFYNVPARRKFLKSNSIELKHIYDEFFRVVLAHSDINFSLFVNDELMYRLKSGNLAQRIVEVFGRKIQNHLVPLEEETDFIKISGCIAKPEASKKSRGEQFFFVNNRFFRSNYFNKAVIDAFEGIIPVGNFPSFFIFLEINPEMIDVNIHPTKTEIKFEDESIIFGLLRSVVKRSIGVYNLTPTLDFQQDKEIAFLRPKKEYVPNLNIKVNPSFNPFKVDDAQKKYIKPTQEMYSSFSNSEFIETKQELLFETKPTESVFRLENGFWIWENENKLYLIDVFRVHQTILFEKWTNKAEKIVAQNLLFPIEYPISTIEFQLLKRIENQLLNFGFSIRLVSDMTYINAIPSDFSQEKIYDFFDYLLKEIQAHPSDDFDVFFRKSIAQIGAKKKNEVLTKEQFLSILEDFKKNNLPLYNPSGKKNYEILPNQIN